MDDDSPKMLPVMSGAFDEDFQKAKDTSQGRKQRPISSYVFREDNLHNQNSLFGSITNLKYSQNKSAHKEYSPDKGKHGFSGPYTMSNARHVPNTVNFNINENENFTEIAEDEG